MEFPLTISTNKFGYRFDNEGGAIGRPRRQYINLTESTVVDLKKFIFNILIGKPLVNEKGEEVVNPFAKFVTVNDDQIVWVKCDVMDNNFVLGFGYSVPQADETGKKLPSEQHGIRAIIAKDNIEVFAWLHKYLKGYLFHLFRFHSEPERLGKILRVSDNPILDLTHLTYICGVVSNSVVDDWFIRVVAAGNQLAVSEIIFMVNDPCAKSVIKVLTEMKEDVLFDTREATDTLPKKHFIRLNNRMGLGYSVPLNLMFLRPFASNNKDLDVGFSFNVEQPCET